MDREGIPQYQAGQGWDSMVDYANARWMCPVCAETHCPKTDLKDRIFAHAGMEGITNDKKPSCVVARIGDFDFNQKYTWKGHTSINIQVFIDTLREGTLLTEINGRPLNGNLTILEAIGELHEKAQTFFQTHFNDKIVTFEACDFRLDPKKDRSGRVAVCEDRRLSLQHAGQDVPALMLDVNECPPLEADELLDILVTLCSFYDTSTETPRPAQKAILRLLVSEVPERREQIGKSMDQMAHSLSEMQVSEK